MAKEKESLKSQPDDPNRVRCAVITVSDTANQETDECGDVMAERLVRAGHEVVGRKIVPDNPDQMWSVLESYWNRRDVDAILVAGGTGINLRDKTFEVVMRAFHKYMPGYGELYRMLSYQQIGPAAMLSRPVGGVVSSTVLLTMPGHVKAVELAMDELIVPVLRQMVELAQA